MQIVVHFRKTTVLQYDDAPSGAAVRESIAGAEQIPHDCFYMQLDGKHFADDEVIQPSSSMVVRASIKVNGGKGGFGAMLKSMAKKSGQKKTTDFGACRDLSGRRLRHVNDELILKKWQEAKDRGDEFDTAEDTQTGIDLWFLSAPSWAEGFQSSHRKKYMKGRTKTRLCLDWLNARKDGQDVPRRAPAWWGCPRGPRCEFAHGEDELQGDGLKNHELQKKAEEREEERRKKDTYMGAVESNQSSEEMESMVAAGLGRLKKKNRKSKGLSTASTEEMSSESNDASAYTDKDTGSLIETEKLDASSCASVPHPPTSKGAQDFTRDETFESQEEGAAEEGLAPPWWLESASLSSATSSLLVHPGGVVQCTKGFGSALVRQSPRQEHEGGMEVGRRQWYYEVELITGGLMQIGWVDRHFVPVPSASSDTEEEPDSDGAGAGENGVGDDLHSWAYDGFRQMSWNEAHATYPNTKKGKRKGAHDGSGIWKAGDIVGCLLEVEVAAPTDLQKGRGEKGSEANATRAAVSFQLNGCDLGVAFSSSTCASLQSSVCENLFSPGPKALLLLLPGVSLEEGQSAAVNIGQRPFKFNSFPDALSVFSQLNTTSGESEESEERRCKDSHSGGSGGDDESSGSGGDKGSTALVGSKSDSRDILSPIDLDAVASARDLEAMGLSHLKAELERRGLKVGGTLEQRAARLFAVRGLLESEVPLKLMAKKSK